MGVSWARGKGWAREVVVVYAMQIAGEARHDVARWQPDESILGAVAQNSEEGVFLECRERDKWFGV